MVKDAESHADEDKKKRKLVEARNKADQVIYSTEKSLKEYGDKISEEERGKIKEAIEKLRAAMQAESPEIIETKIEEVMTASHTLAEELYKKTTAEQAGRPGTERAGEKPKEEEKKEKEGAVDADYEVVDDK